MKTERFLYYLGKAVFIHIRIQEPEQKTKENFPVDLMRPSLKPFFKRLTEKLCHVQVSLHCTEGHLLTSSGCLLTLTFSLDIALLHW